MPAAKCKVCEEKERVVLILTDEVDFLRQLVSSWENKSVPVTQVATPVASFPGFKPSVDLEEAGHVRDDAEDVMDAYQNGQMSREAAEAALSQIGALSTEVTIDRT